MAAWRKSRQFRQRTDLVEQHRAALRHALVGRGVPEQAAAAATYAVHPFEPGLVPANRAFETSVRMRTEHLATILSSTPSGEIGPRSVEALSGHLDDAVVHGDDAYRDRFRQLLDVFRAVVEEARAAAVAPGVPRTEVTLDLARTVDADDPRLGRMVEALREGVDHLDANPEDDYVDVPVGRGGYRVRVVRDV